MRHPVVARRVDNHVVQIARQRQPSNTVANPHAPGRVAVTTSTLAPLSAATPVSATHGAFVGTLGPPADRESAILEHRNGKPKTGMPALLSLQIAERSKQARLLRSDAEVGPNTRWAPDAHEPLTPDQVARRAHFSVASCVVVDAADEHQAAAVSRAFEAVLGKAHASVEQRHDELLAKVRAIVAARNALLDMIDAPGSIDRDAVPAPAATAPFVNELKRLTAPREARAWSVEDALAAARAGSARTRQKLGKIEIVVVPEGKSYLAMPQAAEMLKEDRARGEPLSPGDGVAWRDGSDYFLFVPEQDLQGNQASTRHELYHLLEWKYLGDDVLQRIDDIHADTVDRGGPFARSYGIKRDEFLTTMGEEFEGAWGPNNNWLQQEHRALYDILVEATGRTGP